MKKQLKKKNYIHIHITQKELDFILKKSDVLSQVTCAWVKHNP